MVRGSCLCQAVRYEVRGPFGRVSHCHCSMCRKIHGAAFGTYARVRWSDFVWLSGAEHVVSYPSSAGATRTFCRHCGSTLQFISEAKPDTFALAFGTLDDDPAVRPVAHIFVRSKAPWFDITDPLPQHDEF